MMVSIDRDGPGLPPPDRPTSFLIVDPSGMIDDGLAEMMLARQPSLRVTKSMQQATDEMGQFPSDHRSVVIYIEEVDQLLRTIETPPESASLTYVVLIGDKTRKGRTIADLFDAGKPH